MSLNDLVQQRLRDRGPVRVGLIGAGKFGSMFLSQVPTTAGLEVSVIADLDPQRARDVCGAVGWDGERLARTRFVDDGAELIACDVDVVVEATGHPPAGVRHARRAVREGKDIVMVNVEADVLAGPLLAREARRAGVVYSMAYGDQPALTCELVDWGRLCGFEIVAAGKGTRYLPVYHASTPATVWEYYGLSAAQAEAARMNSQMFNSFLDGTKSGHRNGCHRQRHRPGAAAGRPDVPALRQSTICLTSCGLPAPAGCCITRGRWRWCRRWKGTAAPVFRGPALGCLCRLRGAQRLRRGLLPAVWARSPTTRGAMPPCTSRTT